jgi:hypothetical protein
LSKIALSGNALGTGTFTIASPNSNSDRTLNLPDNSGTMVTTASTAAVTQSMLETLVVPLGVDQTWQNVTASRAVSTTYTNTTGRPIVVAISGSIGSFANYNIVLSVDGVIVEAPAGSLNGDGAAPNSVSAIVPNGATYRVAPNAGTLSINYWVELR